MSTKRRPDRPVCFYCGVHISDGNHERDHFPFPQQAGGTLTVDSCRSCHDMKDRYRLTEWPEDWWDKGIIADWHHLSRESRLWLAKMAKEFALTLMESGKELSQEVIDKANRS